MRRVLAAVLGMALVAAACGSSGSGGAAGSTEPVGEGTSPAAGTTTGAAPTPTTGAGTASTGAASSGSNPASGGQDLDTVRIKLTRIAELDQPLVLTTRPGDPDLYVAEQGGVVWALHGSEKRKALDISKLTRSSGEQGLLGLAFAPDGRHVYVSYTDRKPGNSHIDEYAVGTDGSIDPSTRRQVLEQDQPFPNHNGGNIVFGPDGDLYIGFGDGGSEGDPQRNGQKTNTWLSKLLRIDPRPANGKPYSVPADNPFVGNSSVLPEIWSNGLRNPWRFSFDSATGDLWIGDVGQNTIEEIDFVPKSAGAGRGINFGWSAYEGSARYNDDQQAPGSWMPFYEYHHGDAGCSVTGGYRYRGKAIPALHGAYLFSDYCAGGVNALGVTAGGKLTGFKRLDDDPPTVSSFGIDQTGELYVLSLAGGVYRIDPA
jgi:glucose/arabinose dehydrogenase